MTSTIAAAPAPPSRAERSAAPRTHVVAGLPRVLRAHAADAVFERLARAIVRGEYPIGSTLPPERVLAQTFQLSRVIARQAVHRLAEVGLVAVRQGGKTVVRDLAESADLRVIELLARMGPTSARDVRALGERQILNGHSLLVLAQARATDAERAAIAGIVADYAAVGGTDLELPAFEVRFWSLVAEATQNRLYRLELRWWHRLLATQPRNRHVIYGTAEMRLAFYGQIVRRLTAREDAAAYYLEISSVVLRQLSGGAHGGQRPAKPGALPRAKRPATPKRSPK